MIQNCMKKLYQLAAIIILCFTAHADDQTQNYAPRDYSIIPPSPEVSSLINFYDIPVDYFHGLPDIALPIYELTQGSLKVPISIRYHGGGVKVNEMEGNLGLSWALVAGGVIARTVYGAPDDANETNLKGLFHAREYDKKLREYVINKTYDSIPVIFQRYVELYRIQGLYGMDYYQGKSDMANDILKINGMGLSGTFIYNDDRDLVLSSDMAMTIEPSSLKVSRYYPQEFIVTDNKHNKYHFAAIENSIYNYRYGNPVLEQREDSLRYISAWHLSKITNNQGDSIVFRYRQRGSKSQISGYFATWYKIYGELLEPYTPQKLTSTGSAKYYPLVLESVENNNTIIRFHYSDDENLSYRMGLIEHVDLCTKGLNQQVVKRYDFVYKEYLNNYYDRFVITDRKRKMLSEIKMNNNTIYKFDYYTDENGMISLSSHSQDFCGYNNDRDNPGLIPKHGILAGEGADRSVNPNTATMGALKSIIYPTGGKSVLEWESNEYGYIRNMPVTKSLNTPTITTFESDTLIGLEPANLQKLRINDFRISNNEVVYLDLTQYFCFNPQILALSEYEHEHSYDFRPQYPGVYFFRNGSQSTEPVAVYYIDKPTVEERNNNTQFEVVLPAGSYRVELRNRISVEGREDEIKAQFRYDYGTCGRIFLRRCKIIGGTTASMTKDYWGGLRIRRIISDPDDEGQPIIKDYFYNSTTSPDECSGTVNVLPYYYHCYFLEAPTIRARIDRGTIYCLSSHGFPSTPIGDPSAIEYPEVSVRYSSQDRYEPSFLNYYGEKYWYTTCDSTQNQDYNNSVYLACQPRHSQMWTSNAHRRGTLLRKQTGIISPLDVTTYEYSLYESEQNSLFTTDLFTISDFNCLHHPDLYGCAYDFGIGKYTLIPYNKTVKRERYTEAEGFETETEYEYFYDEYTDKLDRNLVKVKRTTDSDGSLRAVYYTYLMAAPNLALDYPETEVTVVDGKIVEASRMEYDEHRRLKAVYGLSVKNADASAYGLGAKSASAKLRELINRPEYSYKYDYRGNLAEISYNGVVLASYLWGYMGSYPIVEAKFLPHSQLVAAAGQADGRTVQSLLDGSFTSAAQLNGFFTKLRAQLPATELTTMTYHWLLGISEATDPRGVKTTFTYDQLGRLSGIKDYNGYFIKKYLYHFKEN